MWSKRWYFKLMLIFFGPQKILQVSPWNRTGVPCQCVWCSVQWALASRSMSTLHCSVTVKNWLVSSWWPQTCSQDHFIGVALIVAHVTWMRSKFFANGLLFHALKHLCRALSLLHATLSAPPTNLDTRQVLWWWKLCCICQTFHSNRSIGPLDNLVWWVLPSDKKWTNLTIQTTSLQWWNNSNQMDVLGCKEATTMTTEQMIEKQLKAPDQPPEGSWWTKVSTRVCYL